MALDFFLIFVLMRFYQFDPHNYSETKGYFSAFFKATLVMGALILFIGMIDKTTDLSRFLAGYFLSSVVAKSFDPPNKLRADEFNKKNKLIAWLEGFKISIASAFLLTLLAKLFNWIFADYWIWLVGILATILIIGKFVTGALIIQNQVTETTSKNVVNNQANSDWGFYSLVGIFAFIYLFSKFGILMIDSAALSVENWTDYKGIALGYLIGALINPAIFSLKGRD